MQLPFNEAQFLRVFADYNTAFWPALLALWLVSIVLATRWLSGRRISDTWLVMLLAAHWLWAGISYHLLYFTRIDPAAYLFGALFIAQALVLLWFGLVRSRLRFGGTSRVWRPLASALVVYALAYPLITLAVGFHYPRMATFGVPCPTVLLTVGLLLATSPPAPRLVALIPFSWCLIGGSAAFLLDVYPDWALLLAGVLLLLHGTLPRAPEAVGPA